KAINHLRGVHDRIKKVKGLGGWVSVGDFSIAGDVTDGSKSGGFKPNYSDSASDPFELIKGAFHDKYEPSTLGGSATQEQRYLQEYAGKFFFPLIEDIYSYDESGKRSKKPVSTPRDVIFGLILGND